MALAFRWPVYHCFCAALAVREGSTLVTADRSLVNTFAPALGNVVHLDDFTVVG